MLIPVLMQPIAVLALSHYSHDSIVIVSVVSILILFVFVALSKYNSRSQILYYWVASSITYVIIVFQNIVVPLSEIESKENFVLVLLTRNVSDQINRHGNTFSNGVVTETCPVCRVKVTPRSYHCRVCQICVAKYDYHCYWLNCCIGESNQHFFVVGIMFSVLALGYASLLILTTICQPDFVFGILLPKDCTDVSATLG
ncbi:UNVERIFIED_CONTAM: hypothetical protein PYX00_008917 [Menopon gallinae]|uniref:Palmitoyltransferase n=1 Tax=Menopon gallinae TaxID=328185 RepID=A0AAW2H9E9_9NEOP